jgi:hypothetical protein
MNNFNYTETKLNYEEDTTIDFNEWISLPDNCTDASKWLYHTFIIDGFMSGPVSLYKGKPLEAKTVKIYDLKDLYIEMNTFKYNEQKFFLYKFEFKNSVDEYYSLKPDTFEPIKCAVPNLTPPYWLMRYAVL